MENVEEKVELGRYKIHEKALICVFEYLFYASNKQISDVKPIEEIISDIMEIPFDECDDFFKAIIFETIKDKNEFVEIISEKLTNWTFDRLCLTDQAILLLFTSEMLNHRVEKQVAINTAVELSKKYCDDNSYKYINAVLDKVGKEYA